MKRKMVTLLMITFVSINLFGCGEKGVAQKEFDNLTKDYEKALDDIEELKSQNKELEEKYLSELDEKADNITSNLPTASASTWAYSSFDGDTTCSAIDNTLFVSVLKDCDVANVSIDELTDELTSAIALYMNSASISPELHPFDVISVTFYDSNASGVVQFTMGGENFELKDIMINGRHSSRIIDQINNK